ncbi:transporter substrate-binding domain-containing protein [Enterobacteriaceae bacterium 4M9]|nr:transporter substrate-binding domain-containing protein [Enterobacteriaceae bacterium 4M9]
MRAFWLILLYLFSLAAVAQPVPAPRTLQLLSRSSEAVADPNLTPAQWRWLREHRKIRLALWQPMLPPYDITTGLSDYGGINADFIGLLAENLGVEIEIVQYPSYEHALTALREGEADFIAQADDNQKRQGLYLSKPYSSNVAVEVVNNDDASADEARAVAVCTAYDSERVMARYPHARLENFSSVRHAMEALAFHQIDILVCDTVTARYLVNQSSLRNITIRSITPSLPTHGFAFATTEKMRPWIAILNAMLTALPESAGVEIHRRWNGGIPLSLSEQPPVFTSLERKWIEEHPHIRVAVAEGNAPVAFFDEAGQLHGMVADILTALRLRTGLTFEIQRFPSQTAAFAAVQSGKAELVAGSTQEGVWQAKLLTTRTWLYNSWVMVGRSGHSGDVKSQRVVSLRGDSPQEWPGRQSVAQIEWVDTWRDGLSKVLNRESDLMIMPLIIANVQLTNKAFSSLKPVDWLDTEPPRFAFGTSRQAWPLVTILNKALINIPPEDMHALTRSGYTDNSFSATDGDADNGDILLLTAIILVLFALAGAWFWRRRWQRVMRPMEDVPTPIYVCDPRGRLLAGNAALCQALGATHAQLRGSLLEDWLSGAGKGTRMIDRGGRRLRLWRMPVSGKRYSLGGWLDVTEQRETLRMLRRAKRRADGASREKSTFLTTMSHEIRTPLSAVIGMLELVMRRGGDTVENRQSIRIAREAAQSLLMLLGNILDVSRIESGRMVLHPERVALRDLIESTAVMFEGLAAQKGLRFALEIDAELNADVLVDAMRLRQIIVNLVANAIKFTNDGEVALRAGVQWCDSDRLQLMLEIEDSGEGIEEAVQKRLFRPFEQGENRSLMQGSGLGLYISRTLAQMMGGDITLWSQPGMGTRVSVALNLPVMEALTPVTPLQAPTATLSGRTLDILIVDDNPAGRLLLSQQLGWFGHRVVSCPGAREALAFLEQTSVDAVISDCNMPGMNGYALAQAVRERWPLLPLIGITADARESVRDDAQAAGMSDCLFKPVTLAMLEPLLAKLTTTLPLRPNAGPVDVSETPSTADEQAAALWYSTQSASPALLRQAQEPVLAQQAAHDEQRAEQLSDTAPRNAGTAQAKLAAVMGAVLPASLLEGENLKIFLSLQISVLDETLASIAFWQRDPSQSPEDALHRLRGGIQLLGEQALEALCYEQEKAPEAARMALLEQALHRLREGLQQWHDTGLQPAQTVLQPNEDATTS